jgi:membrane fusion protein, heavy metal efflux system
VRLRAVRVACAIVLVPLVALAQPGFFTRTRTVYAPKEWQFTVPIRTQLASTQTLFREISAGAQLVIPPSSRVEVTSPQGGRVVAPPGRSVPGAGQPVRRGEPLAIVDVELTATETELLEMVGGNVEKDVDDLRKTAENARREYARLAKIRQLVPANRLKALQEEAKAAEEKLVEREALLARISELELKRRVVVAPLDGVVREAGAFAGGRVTPGQVLFTVVDPTRLAARAEVSQAVARQLETHPEAFVELRSEGRRLRAVLAGRPQQRGERYLVTLRVDARGVSIELPQEVTLKVRAGRNYQRLVIPARSVAKIEGSTVVFVHSAPETFVVRPIVVSPEPARDRIVAVDRGVRPGDRVVVDGVDRLVSLLRGAGSRGSSR